MALTVVKCGGGAMRADLIGADVAALRARGEQVALVHGGAGEIAGLAAELGVRLRTILSPDGVTSRHTDPATLDVLTLAMTGRVKPRLLAALAERGVPAVGLTGLDGGILRARRKTARRAVVDGRVLVVRDDHSGRIVAAVPTLPRLLLGAGFVPVLSPPAADARGRPLNVDADRAAAALAAALRADRLVLLTAAPGVLREPADESTLLSRCRLPRDLGHAATGGMHRKLIAAREALAGGVAQVVVSDGRVAEPLMNALAGAGTEVVLEDR